MHCGLIRPGRRTAGAAVPTQFSQTLLAAGGAVLGGADEHFDEVVVQRVIELALEAPFELWVIEVAGMKIQVVGVDGDGGVFELDNYFDPFAFGAGGKI
jgi:hypothetical protein